VKVYEATAVTRATFGGASFPSSGNPFRLAATSDVRAVGRTKKFGLNCAIHEDFDEFGRPPFDRGRQNVQKLVAFAHASGANAKRPGDAGEVN
jgi:hypothetical protein